MESAEDIFVESEFTEIILKMQAMEKQLSFDNSTLPDWYIQKDEPKSRAGINMGLSVTLDGHLDLLDSFSVDSNYNSFTAMIGSPRDFPLTLQKVSKWKFEIRISSTRLIEFLTIGSFYLIINNIGCFFFLGFQHQTRPSKLGSIVSN